MIKYLLVVFFLLATISQGQSQNKIGEYEYIVVPIQYEFLKGKDKHRLNTLTRYVLRSYGFNAVFQEELPPDSQRCDVLWLDAEARSGLPWTRITVDVRDCNGMTLFRTAEGKSKEKEYKVSYQEAMRKALASFEFYGEDSDSEVIVADTEAGSSSRTVAATSVAAVVADETIVTPEEQKLLSASSGIEQVYLYQDYKLVATESEFIMKRGEETIGKLIPTSQKNTFLVNTSEFNGLARRTKKGFEVERQIEGQEELVVMKFIKDEQ